MNGCLMYVSQLSLCSAPAMSVLPFILLALALALVIIIYL
ncbi:hypothetical protein FHR87_002813 [Azomonas macrocytogenes]|uniref:Uncharacterized protein n=1 Tax=Azomonas macrocytogenes TaxID=69962 RepID=A0A839T4D3_AZOMA|nr:hypothetical protein [Azomonas macrocytogenes]